MNYNRELQGNNTELQEILAAVNALPNAGSGGGGSLATCTVRIYFANLPWLIPGDMAAIAYNKVENGSITTKVEEIEIRNNGEVTFTDVPCGSSITLIDYSGKSSYWAETDGTAELTYVDTGYLMVYIFTSPTVSNESCTITVY